MFVCWPARREGYLSRSGKAFPGDKSRASDRKDGCLWQIDGRKNQGRKGIRIDIWRGRADLSPAGALCSPERKWIVFCTAAVRGRFHRKINTAVTFSGRSAGCSDVLTVPLGAFSKPLVDDLYVDTAPA